MRRGSWLFIGCITIIASLLSCTPAPSQQEASRKIDVGGPKLRVKLEGQNLEGRPAVVFVSGLGEGAEAWEKVQPSVAHLTRTVSYDRTGLGQSDPDEVRPTFQRVATQLHSLLQTAGVKPPYVLVGHSIGGPHIRMFAGLYPSEVAGLVFVDPTDFTQTRADQLAIWTTLGPGEAGLSAFDKAVWQPFAQAPPAIRAEAEVAEQMTKSGWEEFRSLPPLPDIPVVILMAGKVNIPPEMKLVMGRQRIEHFTKLGIEVSDGALVITNRSGHGIQFDEPELVIWAIRRVLGL